MISEFNSTRPSGLTRQTRSGFTLLEMLIVLTILGLLAAMVYPAAGMLNDWERHRITINRMEEIRRAIVGDPDRFDDSGLRVIAGYVGDMEEWPGLYEAAPEVKQSVVGVPPAFDPDNVNNPDYYIYRPTGHFTGNSWQWNYPFRQLTDDTLNSSDHIGGLETENEGQPVGLWTDNPIGDSTGMLDPERWQGPYLLPPMDHKPNDTGHLARTDEEYAGLEPMYHIATSEETWVDGDYGSLSGELGEYFDDKEEFRLRRTEYRLEDGWNRAFRFFITADPVHAGATVFWIISEGPDHEGTYPAKGEYNGANWNIDPTDIMADNYDPNDAYNQDNIVMKIYSHEWQAVLVALNQRKKQETAEIIEMVTKGIIGDSLPAAGGFNSGFTGALCLLPRLFRWEGGNWDDEDAAPTAYTKGQPRGLWTATPNSADAGDDLAPPSWASPGIGWSGAFIDSPTGINENELIVDGWGRELLFFRDDTHHALFILSRGADGYFDFYDTDTLPTGAPDGINDYLEPASPAEALDIATYDPNDAGGYNSDNVVAVIKEPTWQPGWFTLEEFTVYNATSGVTKAAFYYGYDSSTATVKSQIYTAGVLSDEDGDTLADDWARGGPAPGQAFLYDDLSADPAITGSRRLVIWDDNDADNQVDIGENQYSKSYNILTHSGLEPRDNLIIDTAVHFAPAP